MAERLADRIGIIHGGRLCAEGTLAQLRALSGRSEASLEDIYLEIVREPGLAA